MKLFIAIFFLLSGLAYGQTNFRAVMVDSNGVLQRPTNFVTANKDTLYRYSFSRWYSAIDLVYLDNTTGPLKSTSSGNGVGNPISAQGVQIPDSSSGFNLPVDWRISGPVKVVSYWSDRGYTNVGATNATITVQSLPRTSLPVDNTTTNTQVFGTGITNTFTANYGGSGDSRYYIVEQTVDFGTVTNISGTNPMQIKTIQISRNTNDSSTNIIMLNGIHVYIP